MIASGERTFSRMSSFLWISGVSWRWKTNKEKDKEVMDEIRNEEKHVVVG